MKRREFLRKAGVGTAGLVAASALPNLMYSSSRRADRPNILVILADDLGFSDTGAYGATEIETPNLDRLAAGGQRFTQFYNAARCSPTRASLLTGLYPHQAGMGWLGGAALGGDDAPPGYIGRLNDACVTMGEALGQAGYETMMLGKWHVGNPDNDMTPWQRGFQRYFGRLARADYWDPSGLWLDGEPYDWPGDDFFMTDAYGEWAARFIEEHQQERSDQPFLMYLAFNAPHFPLHAPEEDIAGYRDRFAIGWDMLRRRRYQKMIEEGIIAEDTALAPRDPAVPAWEEVPSDEQDDWVLKMAVYAAMVGRMDQNIGCVLDTLEATGALDNTLILFVSDNGASAEGIGIEEDQVGTDSGTPPGGPDSHQGYLMPWANVSDTPFRMYKHFTQEGGIATPLIAHWPAGMPEAQKGSVTDAEGHVMDIMATALDVTGVDYPAVYGGREITPPEGKSLLPVFERGRRAGHDMIFWEHEGHRAVREDNWKLVAHHEKQDEALYEWWAFSPRWTSRDFDGEWRLYDMETDRTELSDVAGEHPERVERMAAAYEAWAKRSNVRDWDDMLCLHRIDRFNELCNKAEKR